MTALLTLREVAEKIGIAEATLRGWRAAGKGPDGFKAGGRRVMYRPEVVEAWLEEQEAATSSNRSNSAQDIR